jgi:hypothetical protein
VPEEPADGFTPGADFEDEAQPVISSSAQSWRSPMCGAAGSCVEIADLFDGAIAVRDGTSGDASPVLIFTRAEWDAFTTAIKTGELG